VCVKMILLLYTCAWTGVVVEVVVQVRARFNNYHNGPVVRGDRGVYCSGEPGRG